MQRGRCLALIHFVWLGSPKLWVLSSESPAAQRDLDTVRPEHRELLHAPRATLNALTGVSAVPIGAPLVGAPTDVFAAVQTAIHPAARGIKHHFVVHALVLLDLCAPIVRLCSRQTSMSGRGWW